MSDALERRIAEEIERRRDALVALLTELVAFDTRAPGPDFEPRDEAALQAHVADRVTDQARGLGHRTGAGAGHQSGGRDAGVDQPVEQFHALGP